VPIQLFDLTHSTLQVGLLYLTTLVPLLITPIVGGAVADAVDRRTMLLISEGGFALVSIALAVNASLPSPHAWALYVLDFLGTAVFSFGTPALRSLLPRLVRDEKIVAATALDGVSSNFNAVAGPAIGGLVIAAIGFTGTYLLDVASFGASLVSIWMLPKLPPAHDAEAVSVSAILDGFRYVRRTPVILGIFLVDTNAMIFGMPMALFPAIGEHFGGGSKTVGFLYAAPYAGALIASLLSGWANQVRRQGLGVEDFQCLAAQRGPGAWRRIAAADQAIDLLPGFTPVDFGVAGAAATFVSRLRLVLLDARRLAGLHQIDRFQHRFDAHREKAVEIDGAECVGLGDRCFLLNQDVAGI